MRSYLCFLLFFSIIKQKGNTKIKRNSLNFSVLYLPTFQETYSVTATAPDIGVQQKPTYRCSGHSFSGSGFSGSFLNFLVLVLLVIDGFDSSARFAGFSFLVFLVLVLLVLALLVLGGGFSRFSSSSGSSSKRNRKLLGQRYDLSISLFFYTQSINYKRCKLYKGRRCQQQQPFFLALESPQPLLLYQVPSKNVYYYSSNKNNKQTIYNRRQRKVQEARCYMDVTTRGKWLFSSGVWNNQGPCVFSIQQECSVGVFGVATQIDYSS